MVDLKILNFKKIIKNQRLGSTCVFVQCKVRGGATWCCLVGYFAILARVWVVGHDSDNRCPRSALRAQANSIADWVECGSVVINVNQINLHVGY